MHKWRTINIAYNLVIFILVLLSILYIGIISNKYSKWDKVLREHILTSHLDFVGSDDTYNYYRYTYDFYLFGHSTYRLAIDRDSSKSTKNVCICFTESNFNKLEEWKHSESQVGVKYSYYDDWEYFVVSPDLVAIDYRGVLEEFSICCVLYTLLVDLLQLCIFIILKVFRFFKEISKKGERDEE